MTLTIAVKNRVQELLAKHDKLLYRVGREGGISPNTIKAIVAGQNKNINLKTVMQLIRAFGITASEFFDSPIFESFDLEIDD